MNVFLTMAEKANLKGNDKRLVVYIAQEMYQELERLAEKEDRSVSNFTRNLLSTAIEEYKERND